ncbi:acyl--CoA ligase [Rhodopseudomonas sp. HC1]|uniref:class I adenylate-forming enzyme family protein n=1 Tax=Rhodopseudomonas infernalis TaxID=2897386 RepID=UPI001EE89D2A|nr:class I adenylate-forming enzyme family protein [Rhodopseudomonas infernalis]MCG6205237.1 acyl--CoA ligase [Rhodopseudomonas infernalis]
MSFRWKNLGDLVDRSRDLDRPAIIDLRSPEPRVWTHSEIDRLANGVASYLTGLGLARGTTVAILSLNRAEYIAAYFGIMRAGFVALPVNTKQPAETIDFVLRDSDTKFAFVDTASRQLLPAGFAFLDFDDAGPEGFAARIVPGEFETVEAQPGELGQILYTSGSTGRPKGVELSHDSQLWALAAKGVSADTCDEVYIIAQPLFHMNGLFGAKSIFASNASMVLMPGFDSRRYLQAMADHGVTAVTAVPTMFARLLREPDLLAANDYSRLKRLALASAPITRAMADKIQAAFPHAMLTHGYGTTEAGPSVFGPHPEGKPLPPLTIGYPIDPSMVKLVDGPSDDEGVLLMRNPALMTRYRGMPEKTASVMRDGWYYSGDVMRRDADGFYYFIGRADDMFVCGGENIYPGDVEKMLETHPAVRQAAVVPLADEERGQMPVAFLVLADGQSATTEDIKAYALRNGPTYQHPRRVSFVADLPWAGTNKIDRAALIREAKELEASNRWSVSSHAEAAA